MAPGSQDQPTLREMMATFGERLTNHIRDDEQQREEDRILRQRMHNENIARDERASDGRRELHRKIDDLAQAIGDVERSTVAAIAEVSAAAKAEIVVVKTDGAKRREDILKWALKWLAAGGSAVIAALIGGLIYVGKLYLETKGVHLP